MSFGMQFAIPDSQYQSRTGIQLDMELSIAPSSYLNRTKHLGNNLD